MCIVYVSPCPTVKALYIRPATLHSQDRLHIAHKTCGKLCMRHTKTHVRHDTNWAYHFGGYCLSLLWSSRESQDWSPWSSKLSTKQRDGFLDEDEYCMIDNEMCTRNRTQWACSRCDLHFCEKHLRAHNCASSWVPTWSLLLGFVPHWACTGMKACVGWDLP